MTKAELKKKLQARLRKEEEFLTIYAPSLLEPGPQSIKDKESDRYHLLQKTVNQAKLRMKKIKRLLQQVEHLKLTKCAECRKEILVLEIKPGSRCTSCATN